MNKTLRISFALQNAYRVNTILYSIKQIPLIKRILPDSLYKVQGLKIFANVLSVLYEIGSTFAGKFIYMLLMLSGISRMYAGVPAKAAFLHILLFLTIIGVFANTFMFNPSRDKYYAIILMRMNAKEYTIVNYAYAILKSFVGFLPVIFFFGLPAGLNVVECILFPFFVVGLKIIYAAHSLRKYTKTRTTTNENRLGKLWWVATMVLLACAYGLPAVGIYVPSIVVVGIMAVSIVAGIISIPVILNFNQYYEMYQEILSYAMLQLDSSNTVAQTWQLNQKKISTDVNITSKRSGFEYLNELFIKRHQKILWRSSKRVALISLGLIMAVLLLFYLQPQFKARTNELIMIFLPYFVFVMYMINRGTGFTSALFMNCDHSLLTYSFYKQPGQVLRLFSIRLREIVKINLLPAAVIGFGLAGILYASGGTDNPLNYVILVVSILCMSVFFSVHYLTIYYLLQPYSAGTEIKSGTYQIVLSVTYLVCFFFMRLRMPTLIFGGMTIVFCVLYCIVACVLVYKIAPKTFRLRS